MGIFSKVAAGTVEGIMGGAAKLIDAITTDKKEKGEILQVLTKAQTDLNQIEAGHRTVFVAGWRPFIGWVCGFALLYNYIVKDLLNYVIVINYPKLELLPSLQMEHLMTILGGMLGLGTLRTFEKLFNKTK